MNPQLAADLREAFDCVSRAEGIGEYFIPGVFAGLVAAWAIRKTLDFYADPAINVPTRKVGRPEKAITRALRFLHLI